MIRECLCPTREFLPGPEGRCFKCGGLAPQQCQQCRRALTPSEIAGGACQFCGALVKETRT